ncbi:unnamed protein product [Eretmochelys imbricata]
MPHLSAEEDVDPSGAGNNDSSLQRPLQNGKCQAPAGDQPSPPLTILDRLLLTQGLWQLLSLGPEQATELLRMQPPGTFLVTGAGSGELKVLSVQSSGEGCHAGAVCRFHIKEGGSAVSLEGSQLRFLGLLELVAFLSVSRDVLPLPLRLPAALQHLSRAELNSCAALGMRFWSPPFKASATGEEEEETMGSSPESPNPPEMSGPACCIRVTSEDGALCIINPLFLSEHSSEGWLPAGVPPPFHLPERGGTIRLKNGQGPGLLDKLPAPADAEMGQLGAPEPGKEWEPGKAGDAPPASVKRKLLLRRPAWNMSEDQVSPPPTERQEGPASPHRVSWIEGALDAPWALKKSHSESSLLGPRDSLLLPPIPELDSLSVSSVEEEPDAHPATPRKKHQPAALPGRVLHRLSAVGSALTSFLSAERRLAKRVQELTQEPASYVGGLVQNFVGHVLRGGAARHPTSTDLLQEIRQMISSLKGYLCESSELQDAWEYGDLEDVDLGSVVETALYKCVLKPLRDCIYGQLLEFHSRDGSLQKLRDHQLTMGRQSLAELGGDGQRPRRPGPRAHPGQAGPDAPGLLAQEEGGPAAQGLQADLRGHEPRHGWQGGLRGGRLPACPDLRPGEVRHRLGAAGRRVHDGAAGPQPAAGRRRLLPHHLVRGSLPHQQLPVGHGDPANQRRSAGLHPSVAASTYHPPQPTQPVPLPGHPLRLLPRALREPEGHPRPRPHDSGLSVCGLRQEIWRPQPGGLWSFPGDGQHLPAPGGGQPAPADPLSIPQIPQRLQLLCLQAEKRGAGSPI